jgi:hypothetical protein
MNQGLVYQDYLDAANRLKCDVAAVMAVCEVEAPKGGFFPDGTPTTLFEGHKFCAFTDGRFSESHPEISYENWTREHYGKTWQREKERLAEAISLDREAALKSASWGKFQIMGFNHEAAGFPVLQQFVNAMYRSEAAQLDAFVNFVRHEKLDDELREKRWADFAAKYNGPGYKKNQYDTKLAAAFERHTAIT